jgi:hypothetical protein
MEIVYHGNRSVQWMHRKIRIVVKIAQERDGETIHASRPARQGKSFSHNVGQVGLEQKSIARSGHRTSGCSRKKKLTSCGGKQRQTSKQP